MDACVTLGGKHKAGGEEEVEVVVDEGEACEHQRGGPPDVVRRPWWLPGAPVPFDYISLDCLRLGWNTLE